MACGMGDQVGEPSMATVSPSWMSDDTASASGTISAMRRACRDAGVAARVE